MGLYAERVFPWLFDRSGPDIDSWRAWVLRDVSGDALDVGFGTGCNLGHYPEAVRLTALEPSPGMRARARVRIAAHPAAVALVGGAGEALGCVSGRFDAVVLTLTLCSVRDVGAVLAEAWRALRPGGTLHVIEHVASPDPGWRAWQRRLNPIQRRIGVGCHLDRDVESAIRAQGFVYERLERFSLPGVPGPLRGLFPAIAAVARRP